MTTAIFKIIFFFPSNNFFRNFTIMTQKFVWAKGLQKDFYDKCRKNDFFSDIIFGEIYYILHKKFDCPDDD